MFPDMVGVGSVHDPGLVEENADTAWGSFNLVGAFAEEGFGELDKILAIIWLRHGRKPGAALLVFTESWGISRCWHR